MDRSSKSSERGLATPRWWRSPREEWKRPLTRKRSDSTSSRPCPLFSLAVDRETRAPARLSLGAAAATGMPGTPGTPPTPGTNPSIMLMSITDASPGFTAERVASRKMPRMRCQYRVTVTEEGWLRYAASRSENALAPLSACRRRSLALIPAFVTTASAWPRLRARSLSVLVLASLTAWMLSAIASLTSRNAATVSSMGRRSTMLSASSSMPMSLASR